MKMDGKKALKELGHCPLFNYIGTYLFICKYINKDTLITLYSPW